MRVLLRDFQGYNADNFFEEYTRDVTLYLSIAQLYCLLPLVAVLIKMGLFSELAGATGGVGASGDQVKRFRKRDKMLFYGRRMLRKVKSISNSGQGRKRRAVMRFARKLLQLKKETAPEQLKVSIVN